VIYNDEADKRIVFPAGTDSIPVADSSKPHSPLLYFTMTTIHLLPDPSHAAVQSLKQGAADLADQLQEISGKLRVLDSAWEGGGKENFFAEADPLLRALNGKWEELSILTTLLEREIEQWEETDRRGFSAWQDGRWSAALPFSAGMGEGNGASSAFILPLMTAVSLGDLLQNVPPWLRKILDRLFPPAPPDPVNQTAGENRSKFGDLIDKKNPPAPEPGTSTAVTAETTAEKKYDVLYDVPTQSQGKLYSSRACAPTSVSMVLEYFHNQDSKNQTITAEKLITMMDKGDGTPETGISLTKLTDELQDLGYQNTTSGVNADMDTLKSQLESGPVIVTAGVKIVGPGTITSDVPRAVTGPGNTIHAMVVKGVSADTVLVNDPWSGSEKEIPVETFSKMWSKGGGGYYAIRP
jgi:uncharacterized protein YukE/uncharacterized protein YvpB